MFIASKNTRKISETRIADSRKNKAANLDALECPTRSGLRGSMWEMQTMCFSSCVPIYLNVHRHNYRSAHISGRVRRVTSKKVGDLASDSFTVLEKTCKYQVRPLISRPPSQRSPNSTSGDQRLHFILPGLQQLQRHATRYGDMCVN